MSKGSTTGCSRMIPLPIAFSRATAAPHCSSSARNLARRRSYSSASAWLSATVTSCRRLCQSHTSAKRRVAVQLAPLHRPIS
jgi:hypothetical protein